jgi:hypothetical protein
LTMVYLLILILLFGLIQSILELWKEKSKENKEEIHKWLSIFYIIGFFVSAFALIFQDKENNTVNQLIKKVSTSVNSIDSNSLKQLENINKTISQTKVLISKSDSLNKGIIDVLEIKDSLLTQYDKVNEMLAKQLDFDKEKLKEKKPIITIVDNDIKWEKKDSTTNTSSHISMCLTNIGKRAGEIKNGWGNVFFFNKQKIKFFTLKIPGNSQKYSLPPLEEKYNYQYCFISNGVFEPDLLKRNTSFAVIYLQVSYSDLVTNENSTIDYFKIWVPEMEFGGAKDWQIELAKQQGILNK